MLLKKMKVAMVLFGEAEIGGAEKRFANLFNSLVSCTSQHEFYFFISAQKYDSIKKAIKFFSHPNIIVIGKSINLRTEVQNIRVHPGYFRRLLSYKIFRSLKILKWYISSWIELIKNSLILYKYIKKYEIDIVHTIWKGTFAAAFLKLFYNNFSHVLTYMDVYCDRISKKVADLPISYSLALKKADHIDFLGETYLKELQKHRFRFNSDRISISPCSFINMAPYSEGVKKNTVVFAGRFASKKNPILFIEAAEEILKKRNDIRFEMYGKGDLDVEIRECLKSKNLTEKIKVEYTEEIEKKLQQSKIFLSLQNIDNYPSQSILEAMYFKNVVIATNTGQTAKLIPRNTGFLVGFNKDEIAEKIEYIIDNPEEYRMMADNAREFVIKNHTIEKFTEYILNIYDKFD
jgi:glycosyltransferase involved in cell wall biosynthesis